VIQFDAPESSILGYHENSPFSHRHLLDPPQVRDYCADLMQRFDVRPQRLDIPCGGFSGGNQQKIVLARELSQQPRILLVGQPTRGVDIGAIERIHRELVAARDRGCAILLVSSELDEIMALSDRIVVMCAGRITGEVAAADADERRLGLMMSNAAQDHAA